MMGMFDTLLIEYPLPFNSYIDHSLRQHIFAAIYRDGLQTKDLENLLLNYYISNDGRLFEVEQDDFEQMSNTRPKHHQRYHHGHIRAYTMVFLDEEEHNNFWLEYDLKFTDGLLVSATMIHPTKEELDGLH